MRSVHVGVCEKEGEREGDGEREGGRGRVYKAENWRPSRSVGLKKHTRSSYPFLISGVWNRNL